jgi:uncharacterized protein YjiS (DUF1127 family)
MSVMSFERPAGGRDVWQAVAAMFGNFVAELRRQHKVRRDRQHLMQLPDYLLKDIGVSRFDVDCLGLRHDRPRLVGLPDIGWRHKL